RRPASDSGACELVRGQGTCCPTPAGEEVWRLGGPGRPGHRRRRRPALPDRGRSGRIRAPADRGPPAARYAVPGRVVRHAGKGRGDDRATLAPQAAAFRLPACRARTLMPAPGRWPALRRRGRRTGREAAGAMSRVRVTMSADLRELFVQVLSATAGL